MRPRKFSLPMRGDGLGGRRSRLNPAQRGPRQEGGKLKSVPISAIAIGII